MKCKCGCGNEVKKGKTFLQGHNSKSKENIKRLTLMNKTMLQMLGKHHSEESKRKSSESNKAIYKTEYGKKLKEKRKIYMKEYILDKGKNVFFDENHPLWNGGSGGYRARKTRRVLKEHNIEVPRGYVVHHKDKNNKNNDFNNLEILSRSEHIKIHAEDLRSGIFP